MLSLQASLVAQLIKHLPAKRETPVRFLDWENVREWIGYTLQYSWVFPGGSGW